jgi:hypothetical protein
MLKGEDALNEKFPMAGLYGGRDLTPIHWAIFLDAPKLVDCIAESEGVNLTAKVEGGFDPLQFCISLNRLRCFEELIPYLTTAYNENELILNVMQARNSEFLEVMLRTIDPGTTNANLESLARSASAPCQRIIADYVQRHPGDVRDQNLKRKSQNKYWMDNQYQHCLDEVYSDDEYDEDRRYLSQDDYRADHHRHYGIHRSLSEEFAWLENYPDDKEWPMTGFMFRHDSSDSF